jgi:Domain of unknown function (DUF4845)
MRHSQRGVTFIGWLFLLSAVAIVAYQGIRVIPLYLNYMRVAKSLDRLKEPAKDGDTKASAASARALHTVLARSFEINSIEYPDLNDIEIRRDGDHWAAIADYDDNAPLFGNLTLVVHFHKEVDVP